MLDTVVPVCPEPPARASAARIERVCLAAAFVLTAAWFLMFDHCRPDYLVDEAGHLGNIYHFLEGKPGWPDQMTMLPGYHCLVVAVWKLHPPLKLLTLARFVAAACGLVALAAFALAWRRAHGRPAGRSTLLLALLPILQPFTALAYTDVPALAFVLAAVAAHLANRRALAALAFVAAALVRQTTLVWAAFLVVHETLSCLHPPGGARRLIGDIFAGAARQEFFRHTRWLLVLLALAVAAAGVALGTAGRLTPGTQTGTALHFNPATLHFAGLLALLLGLPLWLARTPAALRAWFDAVRARRTTALALTALALGVAAVLAFTFANPHAWNRGLLWDNGRFTLLRNWPLVWLETHPWLRVASGLNVVLMATALWHAFSRQTHRRALWLALGFGMVLPLATNLVEPRYFIDAAVFILLFAELAPADWRRLAVWWALLCTLHAPFIARGVSLW